MNNRNQQRGRGDGRDRANAFGWNKWDNLRVLSPEERRNRGIDPRDPNKFMIDDRGNVVQTLIGWSPNQGNISDFLDAANKVWRTKNPDKMWRGKYEGSPEFKRQMEGALRNAGEKLGLQFENKGPASSTGEGVGQMLGMLGGNAGSSSPQIPRAGKNGMTRVSPGLYRDSKGNLVRG